MANVIAYQNSTPSIADDAFLAPTATVIGRATIDSRASVFYGAVIRADRDQITLGEGSNLQDNAVIHTDSGLHASIGKQVSIGHGAVVHGAVVEDHCLIGMNATLLNGSHIGAESLVAAGALVLEGTQIPPRSLVAGVPAKVRRELTDEEVSALYENAEIYLQLSAEHKQETQS